VPLTFEAIRDGQDAAAALELVFPGMAEARAGVAHPTAVWRRPNGRHVTIKIAEGAPASRHDRFVLNASRARADAIVTTGKNLREEPTLTSGLAGPAEDTEPLADWRRTILGKRDPAMVVVLSSGRELDLAHPIFAGGRTMIFTGPAGGERLHRAALECGVETVTHPDPSIHRVVEFLLTEVEARLVSIEAGPSTSMRLYRPVVKIDELLLSVFEGPDLPEAVRGAEFLAAGEVRDLFTPSPPYRVEEPSGPWSFQRWVRR